MTTTHTTTMSRAEIDAAIDRVIFDAPGDARVARAAGVPVAEVRRRRREIVVASIDGARMLTATTTADDH